MAAAQLAALPDVPPEDVVGSAYCIRSYTVDEHLGGDAGLAVARRRAGGSGGGADPRLRAQPRVARPPLRRRAPGVLRARHGRGPGRRPGQLPRRRRRRHRPRSRPVLPGVAGGAPARRLGAGAAGGRGGRRRLDRRPLRRRALRHGDADARRHLRAHVGRAGDRRAVARRRPGLLADGDRTPCGRPTRTSCSGPRRTGTSSPCSSSRASTPATTSGCTTASSTASRRRRCAPTSAPIPPTRPTPCGSWRTTTSPAWRPRCRPRRPRAAAVVALTLPGVALLHEGQADGRQVRVPVTLDRRPDEPLDADLRAWYDRLLGAIGDGMRRGRLVARRRRGVARQPLVRAAGGVDVDGPDEHRHLVVVNLSDERADGMVRWPDVPAGPLTLVDLLERRDVRARRHGHRRRRPLRRPRRLGRHHPARLTRRTRPVGRSRRRRARTRSAGAAWGRGGAPDPVGPAVPCSPVLLVGGTPRARQGRCRTW